MVLFKSKFRRKEKKMFQIPNVNCTVVRIFHVFFIFKTIEKKYKQKYDDKKIKQKLLRQINAKL